MVAIHSPPASKMAVHPAVVFLSPYSQHCKDIDSAIPFRTSGKKFSFSRTAKEPLEVQG